MKTILCLHGFLGQPADFDFLKAKYKVVAPNLNDYVELDFEQLSLKFEELYLTIKPSLILGYSFGARLALRLMSQLNLSCELICLAGHMGLTPHEISDRIQIEEQMVKKLTSYTEADFLNYWNGLELFKHDGPLVNPNMDKAVCYLKNYCLSKQPHLKNNLLTKSKQIRIYYGELDTKYTDYATSELKDFNFHILPGLGHRLLHHPEEIIAIVEGIK